MNKNVIAWTIAIVGIGAEIFIATLDVWFDMPHIILNIGGGGVRLIKEIK